MPRLTLLALSLAVVACTSVSCGPPKPREAMKVIDLPDLPKAPPYQRGAIDADLQARARAEIAAAFAGPDPVLRAQSLEATSKTKDADAPKRIAQGLGDKDGLVRFAAAMAAGDLQLASVREQLIAMAQDPDENVRVGVRYALHRIGDTRLSQELVTLSQNPRADVRRNVAMVLGLIGNPSAGKVLTPMLRDSDVLVRLQAAEALWRIGDETGVKILSGGLVSEYADVQLFTVLALAAPRDARIKPDLLGKLMRGEEGTAGDELQLVAARALGQIGADEGLLTAIQGATRPDPRQRALAALALGDIRRTDAQPMLGTLLDDKSPNVRIAAALALRTIGLDPK